MEERFAVNVLEDSESRLLLLKRSRQTSLGPGLWGFVAGHIEKDESPEECALRELHEEIGQQCRFTDLASVGPVRDSFFGGIYEIYLYHRQWLGGEILLNPEHTEYAWVSRDQYRNYEVLDGTDEDIRYLGIWPLSYLNASKLP